MTLALANHFQCSIHVCVLQDKEDFLFADERHHLNNTHSVGHVREVILYGNQQPLIAARTVFSKATARQQSKLLQLGNRPLGALLFSLGQASWSHREYARLKLGDPRYQLIQQSNSNIIETTWARRTRFLLNQKPLLVTEVFLPPMQRFFSSLNATNKNLQSATSI